MIIIFLNSSKNNIIKIIFGKMYKNYSAYCGSINKWNVISWIYAKLINSTAKKKKLKSKNL